MSLKQKSSWGEMHCMALLGINDEHIGEKIKKEEGARKAFYNLLLGIEYLG